MAGGYTVPSDGAFGDIQRSMDDVRRRIAELERPTGTQLAEAVKALQAAQVEITALVEDLQTEVDNLLSVAVNTGDVNATGNITAGGDISTPATVRGDAGVQSIAVHGNILTTDFRAVYVSATGGVGAFGHVPSSARFKSDIESTTVPPEMWRALRLVTYRYTAAVEALGDEAAVEVGLIAEEVHDAGLTWLVDYDDDGRPFSLKREALAFALIPAMQQLDVQVQAQDARLAVLESVVGL